MSDDRLPAGWTRVGLSEVGEIRLGRQRSPKNHQGPNMRPYLRAANIGWSGLLLDDVKQMNFSAEEFATYELLDGDVLLSEGSGSIGEVGKPAVWREQVPGCCFQNTLIRVRGYGAVDPDFLAHRLRLEALLGRWSAGFARGVGIHHLGSSRVATWSIDLPPLREQARIVAELERRLSHLVAAVRGLQSAKSRLVAVRREIHDGVADGSILGLDSSDWKETLTGAIGEVRGGIQKQPKRAPGKNARPFLRVANVARGRLDLSEVHQVEVFEGELATYQLVKGDLLVVEGNGSIGQIGRAAMWDGSIIGCVHQNHLIRVRPGPDVVPGFLALVWNAPSTIAQLKAVASSTSGLHTLSTGKVRSVRLKVPGIDAQQALVAEAERRLSLVDAGDRAVSSALGKANQLRSSLLAAAFEGRLVLRDPDDEPAAVTLARVRETRAGAQPLLRRRTTGETRE